jgi:hypothetical protein
LNATLHRIQGKKVTQKEPPDRFVRLDFDQMGKWYEGCSAMCSFYARELIHERRDEK